MRALTGHDVLFLLMAARWTVLLSLGAFAGGGLIGVVLALARVSPRPWLHRPAGAYIKVVQGTPLLLQLFLIFFGSDMLGVPIGLWPSAVLSLSINAGAFLGEIWRGAIQSVGRAQVEAAHSLGLRYWMLMVFIVLPQALRVATAPTVGFMVALIKNTSLTALLGLVELNKAGEMVNNATLQPFVVFGIIAGVYFAICAPLTFVSRHLERKLSRAYAR